MANNTIIAGSQPQAIYETHITDEAVLPGQLLRFRTGASGGVHKADGTTGAAIDRKAVVIENSLDGDVNKAYAANDSCRYATFAPGAQVYLRVKAGSDAIVFGDKLVATNEGYVQKEGNTQTTLAFALEAVNASSSTIDKLVLAEFK